MYSQLQGLINVHQVVVEGGAQRGRVEGRGVAGDGNKQDSH